MRNTICKAVPAVLLCGAVFALTLTLLPEPALGAPAPCSMCICRMLFGVQSKASGLNAYRFKHDDGNGGYSEVEYGWYDNVNGIYATSPCDPGNVFYDASDPVYVYSCTFNTTCTSTNLPIEREPVSSGTYVDTWPRAYCTSPP